MLCCVRIMSLLLFLDMGRQGFCLGSLGADMVNELRAGFVHLIPLVLVSADKREVQTQLAGLSCSTAPFSLACLADILSSDRK